MEMSWWDDVVNFFTGGGDAVVGATGAADVADTTFDSWDFSSFESALFGTGTDTAQSVAESVGGAAADGAGDAAQDTATALLKDTGDKTSFAEKLFTDAADNVYNPNGGPTQTGAGPKEPDSWWKSLDKETKALLMRVGGGTLAGLGAAGAQASKGGQREDELRLQAELAGPTAQNHRAGVLAATQAANRVPAGAPFKPKAGAQLTNRLGQPVALPYNPMRPGLINGALYGTALS